MKTNNPAIRKASPDDFSDIVRIVEEISAAAPEKTAQFNWNRFQISDELQKSSTLVSVSENSIKAFVCTRETSDFYEITVLATAVSARNQGYQSGLISAVIDKARHENKNILLEVHEENLGAINFYRKHGFAELPSRKNYYSDGKSALVFIYRM